MTVEERRTEGPERIPPAPGEWFWSLHRGLPQQGPGDEESTLRALTACSPLPDTPLILDVGCGPGRQSIDVLRATRGTLVALDMYAEFLVDARTRADEGGRASSLLPVQADMRRLPFRTACFDLIWSEGAVYVMGFENGLRHWRSLLKPGGFVALTEAVWLSPERPPELQLFWDAEYPAIGTVDALLEISSHCGFDVLEHFTLPDAAWWRYYDPIAERLDDFVLRYGGNESAAQVISAERREMDIRRRFGAYYGYEFLILTPR